ncbi:MAG: TraR/DksA C4-type zinc finger protein [Parcubacteria group bacterium]|jgi:RNA polymerase-binding protein DksA
MIDKIIQEKLKEKLISEKTRLEETLAATETNKAGTDREYQTSFPEIERDQEQNADEMELYESNLAADETLKSELKKVNSALARMESGTYGYCLNCQKEIPIERLEAYPQAEKCLDCKS